MDGDVGGRVAAPNPLGELPAADRLRLEERAVAVVDVPQDAVVVQGAELFVVRVRELVVNDFRECAGSRGRGDEFVEFGEAQDRGFFDEGVFAGGEGGAGGGEVTVVGARDADGVDR